MYLYIMNATLSEFEFQEVNKYDRFYWKVQQKVRILGIKDIQIDQYDRASIETKWCG